MSRNRQKTGFPAWGLVMGTALYCELILQLWTAENIRPERLAVVSAFALGAGGILAFLVSLLPGAWQKAASVAVSAGIAVMTLTAYFVRDAYRVFMSPETVISGAGGVAADYLSLVLSLLWQNLWRIALLLAPAVCYGFFGRRRPTTRLQRGALVLIAAAMYLAGFGMAFHLTGDSDKLSRAYNFDSAVHRFGLQMALTLEAVHSSGEPAFTQIAVPTEETPPAEETVPTEETAASTEEAAPVYGLNILEGLDFAALAASEENSAIAAIYSYVNSLTPSKKNAYTGLFAGKNLILITAESFSREVIDSELTPALYRMATQGIVFTDYYQPAWGASTTSGEFANLVGLVPTNGGSCMQETIQQNLFLTMGKQLSALGYSGEAFHNNDAFFYERNRTHTNLGYDGFVALYSGLEGVDAVWPESDLQMVNATVPRYIMSQPFSVYYMTVSGHCMYTRDGNAMCEKNYDKVAQLPRSESVKCYLAANLELEYAMEALLEQLQQAGIADDTVVVLSADHYPYGLERSETWNNSEDFLRELYQVEDYDEFIRDHSALIIWSGCLEGKELRVDDPVYSLDILPTLSNLFGVPYDSRLLVGRDVFSDAEPLVLWPDYSWKTSLGSYNAQEGIFTPAQGAAVPEDYPERISAQVADKLAYSRAVLDNDYFNALSEAL